MENNDKSQEKLDRIVELLEDLLILTGRNAGIKNAELRKIVGVDMNRITRITKLIKEKREAE